jgi:hypothetical protein
MADSPRLIIELPHGGAVERQLRADPPASVTGGDVVVESGPTDADGALEAQTAGQVVLTLPSPEALEREADTVLRVVGQAGSGVEPIVVVVEAAEELRDEELASLLEAAEHAPRPVILRIVRDA